MAITFHNYKDAPAADDLVRRFDLDIEEVCGGFATPALFHGNRKFSGALHRADGDLVVRSQRLVERGGFKPIDPERATPPGEGEAELVPGTSIYLGLMFSTFGHFLVESIARFWALTDFREGGVRFVFHPWRGLDPKPLLEAGHVARALERFGIGTDDLVFCLKRPVRFERILVPDQSWRINRSAHPVFGDLYERAFAHRGPVARAGGRLYLSRARWRRPRGSVNEREAEALFGKRGFEIVYPEEVSFAELTERVAGAETVAGCDGSAMHVAGLKRGGRVILVDSRNVRNQLIIDRLMDLDAHHVWARCEGDDLPDRKWRIDIDAVAAALDRIL